MVEFSNLGQLQSINQDLQSDQTPQSKPDAGSVGVYRKRGRSSPVTRSACKTATATSIEYAPVTTDNYTANVFNASGQQVDSVALGQLTGGSVQNFTWSPSVFEPAGLYTVQIVNSK